MVYFSGHPKSEQWFNRDYSVGTNARLEALANASTGPAPDDSPPESLLRQSPSAEPHSRSTRPLEFPCSAGNPEI